MTEISFIRKVAKFGSEDFVVTIPRDLRDLFKGKRVKVTVIND